MAILLGEYYRKMEARTDRLSDIIHATPQKKPVQYVTYGVDLVVFFALPTLASCGGCRPVKAPSRLATTFYTTSFQVHRGSPEVRQSEIP